jgi:hypothetical protein
MIESYLRSMKFDTPHLTELFEKETSSWSNFLNTIPTLIQNNVSNCIASWRWIWQNKSLWYTITTISELFQMCNRKFDFAARCSWDTDSRSCSIKTLSSRGAFSSKVTSCVLNQQQFFVSILEKEYLEIRRW